MLRGECVSGRWSGEVFAALPDGEVVFSRGRNDYQGSVAIVAKLDDGRWLHYGWSYGSCSACDSWEGEPEEKVAEEIRSGAAIMDPETFADYLIACYHQKAEWLTGKAKYDETQESYSYDEHTGLGTVELLSLVAGVK